MASWHPKIIQENLWLNSITTRNFPLPLPLFNVEFRKPQFLGKRLGATNNIELGGGGIRLLVFSHEEALELNFLNSFVQGFSYSLISPALPYPVITKLDYWYG